MQMIKTIVAVIVVGVTCLGILGLTFTWYYLFKRVEPQTSGKIDVKGISEPVRILWDSYGIPHVYAANRQDLFLAQGFLHAQNRLWQMELFRRLGQGRLAEITGEKAVELDYFYRMMGFYRAARDSYEVLGEDIKTDLEAYSRGVNAFLQRNRHRLPAEFVFTRHKPDLWRPADSILLLLVNAWILAQNFDEELLSAKLILKLGEAKARRFISPFQVKGFGETGGSLGPESIDKELKYAWQQISPVTSGMKELQKLLGYRVSSVASNNWVVSGKRSASGKPILANDPHLPVTLPSIWYEIHLVSPELNVIGASGPGVPYVIIGHNDRVAWGFTNVMADNVDLYLIKRNPAQPDTYLYKGSWVPFKIEEMEIRVKGREMPVKRKVLSTVHGPVATSLEGGEDHPYLVSVRWSGHEPHTDVAAFAKLNSARGTSDIIRAAQYFGVLCQNLLYADSEGNIGWQVAGKIPRRVKGNGKYPVSGWDEEYVWAGYLPFNELPALQNPEEGYIATANNKTVGDDYPHILSNTWIYPYRVRRILHLLTEKEKFASEDFEKMQADIHSSAAEELMAVLQGFTSRNTGVHWVLKEMKKWDFSLRADSLPALLYEVVAWRLKANLLSLYMGELKDEYLDSLLALSLPFKEILLQMREEDEEAWEYLIESSITEALDKLEKKLGKKRVNWTWGALHRVELKHALGISRVLGWIYNLGSFAFAGDDHTLMAGVYSYQDPFKVSVAPSYRIITDLSDLSQAVAMNTTGQSGHPFSRYYGDMTRHWLEARYHPLYFHEEDVKRHMQGKGMELTY